MGIWFFQTISFLEYICSLKFQRFRYILKSTWIFNGDFNIGGKSFIPLKACSSKPEFKDLHSYFLSNNMNVNAEIRKEDERKYLLTDVSSCTFTFSDGLESRITPSPDNEVVLVKLIPRTSKLKRFEESVLKHYQSTKTVTELAAMCHYNCVKTFTRHFKKCFKESPYRWILKRKMEEVQSLVVSTDLTITEISKIYDFNTVSHLVNAYIKKFGISPQKDRLSRNS